MLLVFIINSKRVYRNIEIFIRIKIEEIVENVRYVECMHGRANKTEAESAGK